MIPICPYCNQPSIFVDSKEVYGTSYGMIYLCRPCDAYCGVHSGTDQPLGSLANAELRQARKEAHSAFDPLWQRKMEKDKIHKNKARTLAYYWLASMMKMEVDLCHIGLMNTEQCKRVIAIIADHTTPPKTFWAGYANVKNRRYIKE